MPAKMDESFPINNFEQLISTFAYHPYQYSSGWHSDEIQLFSHIRWRSNPIGCISRVSAVVHWLNGMTSNM